MKKKNSNSFAGHSSNTDVVCRHLSSKELLTDFVQSMQCNMINCNELPIKKGVEQYLESINEPDNTILWFSDVMQELGDVHNMLAKTSLSKDEYNPISAILSRVKVKIFNRYYELKNKVSA